MPAQTVGQFLIREILPADVYDGAPLDKKGVAKVFQELAVKYPDKYVDILQAYNEAATDAVSRYGNVASIGLKDLDIPETVLQHRENIRKQVRDIQQNPKLTGAQKNDRVVQLLLSQADSIRKFTTEEAAKAGSHIGIAAHKGFRGNPLQATQLLYGDLLVADHKDRPIPLAGLHGYGEGVTPAEYWAGSYGARKGQVSVQIATAKSGFLGKEITYAAQRQVVTGEDCGAKNVGIKQAGDNPQIIGSVLAKTVKGIPAGTVITKDHLPDLEGQTVRIRSLSTCQMPAGVCKMCAGARENGRFPDNGSYVGITSARSLSEPFTQAALCLAKCTSVRMADWSVKNIEDIKVGESVLAADKNGKTFAASVTAVHVNGMRECVETIFRCAFGKRALISLRSTKDHKVLWHKAGFADTREIAPVGCHIRVDYDSLRLSFGTATYLTAANIGMVETFDISIDTPDHLFVLENGMIVSNSFKHTGGAAKGQIDRGLQGFAEIEQFFNAPENFKGSALLSSTDGIVQNVIKAPQGGHYLFVDGQRHYADPDMQITVKKGDTVEAGDTLTDGTPHPGLIATYKGLGAGRVYFIQKLGQILEKNGIPGHLRHVDSMAKAFYDRVRITSPSGYMGYDPDQVVPYTEILKDYVPRQGSVDTKPASALNQYLEKPILHYTIGTRVTPSVVKDLAEEGITEIKTHKDKPEFEPEISRVMDIPATDPDWQTRLAGFNLRKSLLNSATHGSVSSTTSTSYVPKLVNPQSLE